MRSGHMTSTNSRPGGPTAATGACSPAPRHCSRRRRAAGYVPSTISKLVVPAATTSLSIGSPWYASATMCMPLVTGAPIRTCHWPKGRYTREKQRSNASNMAAASRWSPANRSVFRRPSRRRSIGSK